MSVGRELFDLRIGGMYLPAVLLFLIQPDLPAIPLINQPLLPILAGFSLIAAVLFHGLSRNTFGVGGPEENPQPTNEARRRMLKAIGGDNLDSISDNIPRFLFLTTLTISTLIWPFGIGASLYYGTVQFNSLETGTRLILFATYVWALQYLLWRFFTPAYPEVEDLKEKKNVGEGEETEKAVGGEEEAEQNVETVN
jgi:hypothetical protein